jgi:hypothetical protein
LKLRGTNRQEVGENCIIGSSIIFILYKYYYDSQIKMNEMGGAYRMHGEVEIFEKFRMKVLKGGECVEEVGVDGRIILDWILVDKEMFRV